MDWAGIQPNSFRYTQACSVTDGQDYALFSASNASEEMYDFLPAQNDGQFLRFLGKRKHIRKGPVPPEGDLVEEPKSRTTDTTSPATPPPLVRHSHFFQPTRVP